MPDLEFLQQYVELCSDQSIIHLSQIEMAVLWKACKKWGYRMWCCVNTFHSGLLTRQIFVSTLILVFLMFASNKVPVTNQFRFACFSFWFRMIHCWNDITLFSIDFYNYFRNRELCTEGILAQTSLEQSCLQLVEKATSQKLFKNLWIEQYEKTK